MTVINGNKRKGMGMDDLLGSISKMVLGSLLEQATEIFQKNNLEREVVRHFRDLDLGEDAKFSDYIIVSAIKDKGAIVVEGQCITEFPLMAVPTLMQTFIKSSGVDPKMAKALFHTAIESFNTGETSAEEVKNSTPEELQSLADALSQKNKSCDGDCEHCDHPEAELPEELKATLDKIFGEGHVVVKSTDKLN